MAHHDGQGTRVAAQRVHEECDQGLGPDADELLAGLERRLETLARHVRGVELELYQRVARSRRLTRREREGSTDIVEGRDEGLAVRGRTARGNVALAACCGDEAQALDWLGERLTEAADRTCTGEPESWPPPDECHRVDRDDDVTLPGADELREWLERALAALPRPEAIASAWIEVATTHESWAADGGLRASRSRARVWAMVRLVPSSAHDPARPLVVAARRFGDLEPGEFAEVLQDRWFPTSIPRVSSPGEQTLVVGPEASATLVHALVRAVSTLPEGDMTVGPGWCLADDPVQPAALFGGVFDDAVFPTSRTMLADGRTATGSLAGPGHYRRSSYRDAPSARPSHLEVTTPAGEAPAEGLLVTDLSIHAVHAGLWIVELAGAELHRGVPQAPFRTRATVEPQHLPRHCVGAVGPVRSSHLGVRTRALVFDRLPLGAGS